MHVAWSKRTSAIFASDRDRLTGSELGTDALVRRGLGVERIEREQRGAEDRRRRRRLHGDARADVGET